MLRTVILAISLAALCGSAQAEKLNLSESAKAELAKSLRNAGFNCPTVNSAYSRGEDAYGRVLFVRCAPLAGAGTIDQFPGFRLTIRPNNSVKVDPCSGGVLAGLSC